MESLDLRKLAAKALLKPCHDFLGEDNEQCDLLVKKFEDDEIDFDEFLEEMGQVFQHHQEVEKKEKV